MNRWRNHILFACMVAMLIALFISRAALSVSIILFATTSFIHNDIKRHLQNFFSSPVLWAMSLLFLVPLVSGLWSEDKERWADIIRIKLPLLFLPLAFAGPFQFSRKHWECLVYSFIMIVIAGSVWCMVHYLNNMQAVHQNYLKAKTILTPLENDHVRFSWLISIAVLLSGWMWIVKRKENKFLSWGLFLVMTWLIIFLHILAARTGLFSFYIMVFVLALWLIIKKMKWNYGAALLILLAAIPFIAYYTLPSFQNRVKYIQYDLGYFKEAHYLPGANDAVRVISLNAGWGLVKENPVKGVGFGDVAKETSQWYDLNYPGMIAQDKILPGSEWLIYGAGSGIPGLLLFTFCMVVPFFAASKNKLLWWLMNGTAAFSLLFDIGLEVQFGVFIYSFLVLWWHRWLNADEP